MAVDKIFGIETEWSIIIIRDDMFVPADVSELNLLLRVIKTYFQLPYSTSAKEWEAIDDESERELARRLQYYRETAENGAFLPNGSRIYVDWPHLEYSTAECRNILDLIALDKAGNKLMAQVSKMANKISEAPLTIFKNSSNHRSASRASHENYLIGRKLFDLLTCGDENCGEWVRTQWINFLITRQLYTGSGKVGSNRVDEPCSYQISQRADFINRLISNDTVLYRAIINIRDEPHANKYKFGRLHVIVGEANFCDWALFLRIGMAAIVLKMLEDNFRIGALPPAKNFLAANQMISRDLTCKKLIELEDGRKVSAINIQENFLERAYKYFETNPISDEEKLVLERLSFVLAKLKNQPLDLCGYLDWVTKLVFINNYFERINALFDSETALILDMGYHDINPDGSYYRLERKNKIQRLVSDEKIDYFIKNPPQDTRAYLRGKIAAKFPWAINDWDEICIIKSTIKMIGDLKIEDRCVISLDDPTINSKEEMDDVYSRILNIFES